MVQSPVCKSRMTKKWKDTQMVTPGATYQKEEPKPNIPQSYSACLSSLKVNSFSPTFYLCRQSWKVLYYSWWKWREFVSFSASIKLLFCWKADLRNAPLQEFKGYFKLGHKTTTSDIISWPVQESIQAWHCTIRYNTAIPEALITAMRTHLL